MNRQEKEKALSVAKDLISGSQAVFIVNYKGLSVSAEKESSSKWWPIESGKSHFSGFGNQRIRWNR